MTHVPPAWIIVDATPLSDIEYWNWAKSKSDFIQQARSDVHISWIHSIRGLTRQRNRGLIEAKLSEYSLVHFLDDDVEPDELYFVEMRKALNSERNLLGATGSRIGEVESIDVSNNMMRILYNSLIDKISKSKVQGSVNRIGQNFLAYGEIPFEVDWLSGCSMSFRMEVFDTLRFEESFEGYSLMEDLVFSFQLSLRGRLMYWPDAKLRHNLSESNRWAIAKSYYVEAHNRTIFVRCNPEHFSLRLHIARYVLEIVGLTLRSVVKLSKSDALFARKKFFGLLTGFFFKRYI